MNNCPGSSRLNGWNLHPLPPSNGYPCHPPPHIPLNPHELAEQKRREEERAECLRGKSLSPPQPCNPRLHRKCKQQRLPIEKPPRKVVEKKCERKAIIAEPQPCQTRQAIPLKFIGLLPEAQNVPIIISISSSRDPKHYKVVVQLPNVLRTLMISVSEEKADIQPWNGMGCITMQDRKLRPRKRNCSDVGYSEPINKALFDEWESQSGNARKPVNGLFLADKDTGGRQQGLSPKMDPEPKKPKTENFTTNIDNESKGAIGKTEHQHGKPKKNSIFDDTKKDSGKGKNYEQENSIMGQVFAYFSKKKVDGKVVESKKANQETPASEHDKCDEDKEELKAIVLEKVDDDAAADTICHMILFGKTRKPKDNCNFDGTRIKVEYSYGEHEFEFEHKEDRNYAVKIYDGSKNRSYEEELSILHVKLERSPNNKSRSKGKTASRESMMITVTKRNRSQSCSCSRSGSPIRSHHRS